MASPFPNPLEAIRSAVGGVGDVAQTAAGVLGNPLEAVQKAASGLSSPVQLGEGATLDRGGAGNATLRVLDFLSRAGGHGSPIEAAMQRHQQQVEQRRQKFAQNLQILGRMGEFLDQLPIDQREQRAGQLRQRFESEFGGEGTGELFDAVLGDPALAPGTLEQLRQDPEVGALLQNPRATAQDLKAVTGSPEFRQRAIERQDLTLLPQVERKIRGWLSNVSPTLRAQVEAAQRDGQITIEEIRKLNEVAGQGPGGLSLTPAELGTLDRRQRDVAARIPGFRSSADVEQAAEREAEREKFKFEETLRQQGRERIKAIEAGRPAAGPSASQKASVIFKTEAARKAYEEKEFAIQSALENPPSGTNDIVQLMTLISQIDDTAAREGEVNTQRDTQSFVGRIQGIVDNLRAGAAYGPDKRAEVQNILERMRSANQQARKSWATRLRPALEYAGFEAETIVPEAFDDVGTDLGHTRMRFPDGSVRLVPDDRVEAMKQYGEVVD